MRCYKTRRVKGGFAGTFSRRSGCTFDQENTSDLGFCESFQEAPYETLQEEPDKVFL